VDINQVYRAPSIPKIGKRSVSSSVLRGATTPKLKVSTVKFGKPKITAETIQSVSSPARISQSLVETNLILVEIQKQLAIDFANRIAEEKELIKGIKKAESRRKFGAKEKFVESTKKIGSAIGGAVSKITSPVKTVFERIVDFFKAILTGIVLNAAFKWLEDPANKAKLFAVFDFIGKYWKELVITFIGVKVLGFISKLIGLGRLIGKFFGKGGPGSPRCPQRCPSGGGPVGGCGTNILNCVKDGGAKVINGLANLIVTAPIFAPLFKPGEQPKPPVKVPTPLEKPKQPQYLPPGVEFDPARPNLKPDPRSTKSTDNIGDAIIMFVAALIGAKLIAPGVGLLLRSGPSSRAATQLAKPQSASQSLIGGQAEVGNSIRNFSRIFNVSRNSTGGTIRASMGMTVPGKGSGNVDSVNAMLAPGEEVIRTASAMMFRPLLKDINDNAGRLWNTFSQAVTTLISVSAKQKEVSENFDSVTTEFSRYLQDETRKQKFGTGGGTKVSSSPKKPNISSTPKVINLINQGVPVGKGGVNVFSLPPTKSKPPEIPQIQTSETKVPVISPIDFTNPWMDITPELYGIQLYG